MGIVAEAVHRSGLSGTFFSLTFLHRVKQGLVDDGLVAAIKLFLLVPNFSGVEGIFEDVADREAGEPATFDLVRVLGTLVGFVGVGSEPLTVHPLGQCCLGMAAIGVPFEEFRHNLSGFRVNVAPPVLVASSQTSGIAPLVAEGRVAVEQSLPRSFPHSFSGVAGEIIRKILGEGRHHGHEQLALRG